MSESAQKAEQTAAARDAANWAKSVSRLDVAEVPAGATGINVAGRRLSGPIQGFGKMWQKTYQVRIPTETVSAADLVAMWKQKFPEFWPEGNQFYAPLTGIAPGDVALIESTTTLPGRIRFSTGVMVLYADEESFTLMTPEGHVFAGWITFSASEQDSGPEHGQQLETVAQVQVLMRASDPLTELGLSLWGHKQEDRFWQQTLGNLSRHVDAPDTPVAVSVVCVDRRRQWRRWTNLWRSAAIGSTLYMLATPFRRKRT